MNEERQRLNRLADALVEDILNASGEEILEEFREDYGNPEEYAAQMRQTVENIVKAQHARRSPET